MEEVLSLLAAQSKPQRQVLLWDIVRGWDDNNSDKGSVMAALSRIGKVAAQENTIFVLRDLHPILKNPHTRKNAPVVREQGFNVEEEQTLEDGTVRVVLGR